MERTIIVEISDGLLEGYQSTNHDGEHFYCFLSIPYGKPPLGDLRFKAPQPADSWNGVKDATKEGNCCYQLNIFDGVHKGSEDCLNLNVFTRKLPLTDARNTFRPVMVWIHGGGFQGGSNSPSNYGPEFLMLQDIVLVSINYRLGVLGFLSLDDISLGVPGNAGLKDQTLALKWIQNNIEHFGGDPGNVTIFGESAGAVSVNFHVMSECSKGLFHKAIMLSGTIFNPWALVKGKQAIDLCRHGGKNVNDEKDALNILRDMTVDELYDHQTKFLESKGTGKVIFGPVIEQPNETAFIISEPSELLIPGKFNRVPVMMGYNSHEGLLFEFYKAMKAGTMSTEIKIIDLDLDEYVPKEMNIAKDCDTYEVIKNRIVEEYLSDSKRFDLLSLLSDFHFISPIVRYAKKYAESSGVPVYLYRMSLDAGMNTLKKMAGLQCPGACHGDIVGYLFRNTLLSNLSLGEIEDVSIRRFVKLWTNFAYSGNPTPDRSMDIEWKNIEENDIHFLDIDKDLTMDSDPEAERMALWRDIFQLTSSGLKYS